MQNMEGPGKGLEIWSHAWHQVDRGYPSGIIHDLIWSVPGILNNKWRWCSLINVPAISPGWTTRSFVWCSPPYVCPLSTFVLLPFESALIIGCWIIANYLKRDSSKAICIVQVYFLGEAAIARVLTSTVISSTCSSQEIPTKVLTLVAKCERGNILCHPFGIPIAARFDSLWRSRCPMPPGLLPLKHQSGAES